jgi:hypothetical protein
MTTRSLLLLCLPLAIACRADTAKDSQPADDAPGTPELSPQQVQTVDKGDRVVFRADGLDDSTAYRATLVAAANIDWTDDGPRFVDLDGNGAADAGNSTASATITAVNGMAFDGAKTIPAGTDDPADPSGIWPEAGVIDIEVTGVGAGESVLVVYENGGASTFLELDSDGVPVERYDIGGTVQVRADGMPDVTPVFDQALDVGATTTLSVRDLDDNQAYRITLVVAENVDWTGAEPMFADLDASGTADAGSSEAVALITAIQGEAISGAKTFPAGDDDPASPTGVFPVDGQITIDVMGVGPGAVVPVAYANRGASTFLEVDLDGLAVEPHGVGGALWVE